MATKRIHWESIRQYIWLISGLACLLTAFIFWVVTDTDQLVEMDRPIEDTQVQIQPEKVAASIHLGSLQDEVRPLEMTTRVVVSGDHTVEFRGTKFIQDNKKNFSIELFKANEEDVISGFIRKQAVRKNLFYFRLSGDNQAEQYVANYGVFKTEAEANTQLQQLQLGLPASVKPKVIKLGQYADLVNDLGFDETQGGNKLYEVKLKSAPIPIIDETLIVRPKPVTLPSGSTSGSSTTTGVPTTKTTITRKDQSGNVIGVEQSHSAVEQPKPKPKEQLPVEKKVATQEMSDPFN